MPNLLRVSESKLEWTGIEIIKRYNGKKENHVSKRRTSGRSLVVLGGVSQRRMDEFVTADARFVLKKAGRLL